MTQRACRLAFRFGIPSSLFVPGTVPHAPAPAQSPAAPAANALHRGPLRQCIGGGGIAGPHPERREQADPGARALGGRAAVRAQPPAPGAHSRGRALRIDGTGPAGTPGSRHARTRGQRVRRRRAAYRRAAHLLRAVAGAPSAGFPAAASAHHGAPGGAGRPWSAGAGNGLRHPVRRRALARHACPLHRRQRHGPDRAARRRRRGAPPRRCFAAPPMPRGIRCCGTGPRPTSGNAGASATACQG